MAICVNFAIFAHYLFFGLPCHRPMARHQRKGASSDVFIDKKSTL